MTKLSFRRSPKTAAEPTTISDKLSQSATWMSTIVASLSESICVVDKTGVIVFANDAFAALAGKGRASLAGKTIWDVLGLRKISGQPLEVEDITRSWGPTKAGRLRGDYLLDKSIIRLAAHFMPHFEQLILVLRDVTKERDIDRTKTEFISVASHQLRTPLSAINWFCEILLAGEVGKLSQQQREFTQHVAESSRRMTELVNALL